MGRRTLRAAVLSAAALPSAVLAVVLLTAVGCGVAATPRLPSPPPTDDAVELAALLPDEVERCVVARPGRVAERRRGLVLLHSQAEPMAWAADLRPIAYATAVAERFDGRRARRTYYRFADEADERVRDVLAVRWLDEPCERDGCDRSVGRWLDGRTLEVARYEWPRRPLPIPSGACVQLAGAHPDAVEVALDRTSTLGHVPMREPRPSRSVLHVSPRGLSRRREVVMPDPLEARRLVARLGDRAFAEHDMLPFESDSRVEQDGERVRISESRSWEALELAVEDEHLRMRASALLDERSEPVPVSRVRVTDLGAVRHQVQLRRAQLGRLSAEARERAAAELASLLARAWEAHPTELPFALALVRLALDVLADPARARDVATEVLARGLADPQEEWRLLEREALARLSPDELARVLVAEGVPVPEAARAARDLRALAERGVPYEWAEGAWRASRGMLEGRALRRVDARVPFEGVLGALVGWARVSSPARPMTVHVLVRVATEGEVRPIGDLQPQLLAFRGPSGGMAYVGALASPDLVVLRRFGAALADVLDAGAMEVVVDLGEPDGQPIAQLRLAGTLSNGVLTVERVSPELASVRWPLFTRYLAQPLAELPTPLFPSPTLTIRTESDELAAALRRAVEPSHPDACRTAGPVLRCRSPGWPEALGELLLHIAAARAESSEP